MWTIQCGEETLQVAPDTTIGELWWHVRETAPGAVLALYNGELCDFQTPIRGNGKIEWRDLHSKEGNLAYQRSLIMLMAKAVREIFPAGRVRVQHSLGRGLYCILDAGHAITHRDIEDLEEYMHQLVRERAPIERLAVSRRVAINICENEGRREEAEMLAQLNAEEVLLYRCGNFYDYYFGPMLPDMGYLTVFDVVHYAPGFLLRFPNYRQPEKLQEYEELTLFSRVFFEATDWSEKIGCRYVNDLNEAIHSGRVTDIIAISEALHEKKLAEIADMIAKREPDIRLITIAGPSSAGKTTTMKRLKVQMRVNGLNPVMISLDDYFYDRTMRPVDENGHVDNESVGALDLTLLELQLMALMAGEPVRLARFDFIEGERYFDEEPTILQEGQPIMMEGLHALNPAVSRIVPAYQRLNIYIAALTQLTISDHNRVSTTDTRLLRRIVRDHQFRGHTVQDTMRMWESVRDGEEKYIFPYQERADVIFNTALLYELPVLKVLAEPLLKEVEPTDSAYPEAQRLLRFLSVFESLSPAVVPSNSILREFIGNE